MEKSVCIIIVNYNGHEDTIECVKSLRNCTYINKTVVVVDNCSTDNSVLKIEESLQSNEYLIKSNQNLGFSGGNNLGIKYAINHDYQYCLLLNNDTVVENNFLDNLFLQIPKYNKSVFSPKILNFYDKKIWYAGGSFSHITSRVNHFGIDERDIGQYENQQKVSFISGCCILIETTYFRTYGLMDEDFFLYGEDTDLCCKLVKEGYTLMYIPSAVIYHKISSSTAKISGLSSYYTARNNLYIVKKHINNIFKPISYSYVIAEILIRSLKGNIQFLPALQGVKDFLFGVRGKK